MEKLRTRFLNEAEDVSVTEPSLDEQAEVVRQIDLLDASNHWFVPPVPMNNSTFHQITFDSIAALVEVNRLELPSEPICIAGSQTSTKVYIGLANGNLLICELSDLSVKRVKISRTAIQSIAISPNNEFIALQTGELSEPLKLFNTTTGETHSVRKRASPNKPTFIGKAIAAPIEFALNTINSRY